MGDNLFSADDEETREYYQERTRYWLREARRALASAEYDRVMGDREGYLDWMGNATWLITEAIACREEAKRLPWGRGSERKTNMVDSDPSIVVESDNVYDNGLFNKAVSTPILYRQASYAEMFGGLLKVRSIRSNKHYADKLTLLSRREGTHTFGMLFDNELLLALCNGEEQKAFQADADALSFYQEVINKFQLKDRSYSWYPLKQHDPNRCVCGGPKKGECYHCGQMVNVVKDKITTHTYTSCTGSHVEYKSCPGSNKPISLRGD